MNSSQQRLAARPHRASKREHAFVRPEGRAPDAALTACARCLKEFRMTRPWSRFCSTVCRMKFHGRLSGYRAGPDEAPASPQKEILS
jgi:hypothetical protein